MVLNPYLSVIFVVGLTPSFIPIPPVPHSSSPSLSSVLGARRARSPQIRDKIEAVGEG